MANKEHCENVKLKPDCEEDLSKECSVPLGSNSSESVVQSSNIQETVVSVEATKKWRPPFHKNSRNESSGQSQSCVNKSQSNVEEKKSRMRQNQKKNNKPKPVTLRQIDKRNHVKKTNTQRKNRKSSVTTQSNDLSRTEPLTSLPSTSSDLSNGYSKETKVVKTKKGSDENNQYNTSITSNCGLSNNNALRTLFPHVGLPYFPESNKATLIPNRSNKRQFQEAIEACENLQKPNMKMSSLTVDRVYRDSKMSPTADSYLSQQKYFDKYSVDVPKNPEQKRNKIENVKGGSQYPQPVNGKSYPDAVYNPPLANPGTMVGFTPAGQRFEVDLNLDRPTWFSSEYARLQFDDATKINVSRMLSDMECGVFLPAELDADVEKNYKADQDDFKEKATVLLQELASNSDVDTSVNVSEAVLEEHKSKLDTEDELVNLIRYVMLRSEDFPLQAGEKLKTALNMKITPLMLKKNPVLLECIKELRDSSCYLEVVEPAQALLDKIKGLFNVPDNQTFDEHFESEVDGLKAATEHLNLLQFLTLTQEPIKEPSDESSSNAKETCTSEPSAQPNEENEIPGSEDEIEWIPVRNNDVWVEQHSALHELQNESTPSEIEDDELSLESDSSVGSELLPVSNYTEESDSEDEVVNFLVLDGMNGMIYQGYPGYTKIDFFEYI